MLNFKDILKLESDQLAELIYDNGAEIDGKPEQVSHNMGINLTQLLCGLGMRRDINDLLDIVLCLGFESSRDLIKKSHRLFVNDTYEQLSIKDITRIQKTLLKDKRLKTDYLTGLFQARSEHIEKRIQSSVKPAMIENYRQEMQSLYQKNGLPIEFVEKRLENTGSGFRALIDEVGLIVDAGIFTAQEMLHRHDVLTQEKSRLIKRGLIEKHELEQRLLSDWLSDEERELLERSLHEEN